MRIYSFEKLEVWQKARKLTKAIYLTSKNFPDEEKFGLTSQIRRSSVSVCSNIAEWTSRNSFKDKARFTEMSYTSLMEVLNQLIITSDLSFIAQEQYESLRTQIDEVSYMINALHKSQLNSIK